MQPVHYFIFANGTILTHTCYVGIYSNAIFRYLSLMTLQLHENDQWQNYSWICCQQLHSWGPYLAL